MSFPQIVDIEADEPEQQSRLFERLQREEIHAVRLRQAFPPSVVSDVVAHLESEGFNVEGVPTPEGELVRLFGLPLQHCEPDLSGYWQAAARFRESCQALWKPFDYEGRVHSILGNLCADTPVELMSGPQGQMYTPSTIRRVSPGGGIPPHAENHQLPFAGYAQLRNVINNDQVMSFFTLLSGAESGGHLTLHAMTTDDYDRALKTSGAASGQAGVKMELLNYDSTQIALEVGDTLVLNSGRWFHGVSTVQGERDRWTIGGFFAASRGGERVVYWG